MIDRLNALVTLAILAAIPYWLIISVNVDFGLEFLKSFLGQDETDIVYDFIVVGAGSAGAVVANRLSKNNKVLLLEAGGTPPYPHSVPGFALLNYGIPEVDWMHETVPQKHCCEAFKNRVIPWPRGKMLGGTSNFNSMVYIRGHPQDYNNWAKLTNDSGWKYENVLPFFKKSVDYEGAFYNERHYGRTPYGNLHVELQTYAPLQEEIMKSAVEKGFPTVDVNGPQVPGIGPTEVTQKNGKRWDTYTAFLKDIRDRKNLVISKFSTVTKIRMNSKRQAVGVEYLQFGKKKYARCKREVIVSGGSIESPKILLLSGIGPKSHLEKVGVKHRVELPVGKNLHDHAHVMLGPFTVDKVGGTYLFPRDMRLHQFYNYYVSGTGFLRNTNPVITSLFYQTPYKKKHTEKDWTNMQLLTITGGPSQSGLDALSKSFYYDYDALMSLFEGMEDQDGFFVEVTLGRPRSKGELTLRDKNPLSRPLLDPNYLAVRKDLDDLVDGTLLAIDMAENTKVMKNINGSLTKNRLNICRQYPALSKSYFECYVRAMCSTLYHPVGTCKMGKRNDPTAVVDSQLRVNKVLGIRVIDASIMPEIVNGNTNAPTIMIGEKGADIIREYWSKQFLVCNVEDVFFPKVAKKRCSYSEWT